MNQTIIRPGLLVSLKTSLTGGVSYEKTELEADHAVEDGGQRRRARWETTRHIADAAEHEAAVTTRSKARSLITRVCCPSSFGLLCPQGREAELREAVAAAQVLVTAHNAKATATRVEVFVITGRVADSDEEAARAIGAEVRDLIAAMERGIKAAKPEEIREAASKARALAGMLSEETQRKVNSAIVEARTIASEIVQRVGKAGESAASVVDGLKLAALTEARFAVLDIAEQDERQATLDLAPDAGRAVDLVPETAAAGEPAEAGSGEQVAADEQAGQARAFDLGDDAAPAPAPATPGAAAVEP